MASFTWMNSTISVCRLLVENSLTLQLMFSLVLGAFNLRSDLEVPADRGLARWAQVSKGAFSGRKLEELLLSTNSTRAYLSPNLKK